MDWLLDTRTFGFKLRYTTPAQGLVYWENDTLFFRQLRINLYNISEACHQLTTEAEALLLELTHTTSLNHLPSIPWSEVQDDHSEEKVGYNFLSDSRNKPWVDKGYRFIPTAIDKSTAFRSS